MYFNPQTQIDQNLPYMINSRIDIKYHGDITY